MVIISQPRYIPALSYLQRMYFSKKFVLLDIVQRQARGWENRNQLLINGEKKWLTIPISSSSRALIMDSYISNTKWLKSHKEMIIQSYNSAPYYSKEYIDNYYDGVEELILKGVNFSDVIHKTLKNLDKMIGLDCDFILSSEILTDKIFLSNGVDKLVEICKEINENHFVSGPNGKKYGVQQAFEKNNMKVSFHYHNDYNYKQIKTKEFVPYMGFFDALFNMGIDELKLCLKSKWNLK